MNSGHQSRRGRYSVTDANVLIGRDLSRELKKENVWFDGTANETSTQIENDNMIAWEKPRPSNLTNILNYFKEYCDCSGVHGFRYLSESGRNFVERLFWITAIVLSAIGCSLMIVAIKNKMDKTPVIVSFAESPTNIWHIPFPAVTLCPLSKCRQSLFNSTRMAYMFKEGLDLYDDYREWVRSIFSKSRTTLIKSNITDAFQTNDSLLVHYIDQVFKFFVLPDMYGDVIGHELTALLKEILLFISYDLLQKRYHSDEESLAEQIRFTDLYKDSSFRRSMDKYYPVWKNETELKLKALHLVCDGNFYTGSSKRRLNSGFDQSSFADGYTVKFLIKVTGSSAPPTPFWENIFDNEYPMLFKDLFLPTLTEEGVCFTFNMLNRSQVYSDKIIRYKHSKLETDQHHAEEFPFSADWNPDAGYFSKSNLDPYPRRAFGAGIKGGLRLELLEDQVNFDYDCNPGGATGFKIILHRPEDHPLLSMNFVAYVPFFKDVSIVIIPSLMTTSAGLKDYDPLKRQCYYSYENHLEYFKFYSTNNCELECLTKAILKRCGCVAFYMPRDNITKICGDALQDCVYSATKEIEKREIREDLAKLSENDEIAFGSAISQTECGCLPSCTSISYGSKVSMVDYDVSDVAKGKYPVIIRILYGATQFISTQRSELYGSIDFLAGCGGLLGLFSGFSLMSVIEIIYFFTLRLWVNIWRQRKTSNAECKINIHHVGQIKKVVRRNVVPNRSEGKVAVAEKKRRLVPDIPGYLKEYCD